MATLGDERQHDATGPKVEGVRVSSRCATLALGRSSALGAPGRLQPRLGAPPQGGPEPVIAGRAGHRTDAVAAHPVAAHPGTLVHSPPPGTGTCGRRKRGLAGGGVLLSQDRSPLG